MIDVTTTFAVISWKKEAYRIMIADKIVDADAVDYKLISICHKGDVVVSQDYGVAAMALGKGLTRSGGPWP